MEYSMWAYPWDIIDEGVDTVADRLTTVGVSEVNVATNYHSIQTFNPHNPARRTFFSHASAYFHPGDEYGRLKPIPNEMMGDDDWLATIDKGLRDTPLDLNSWTIGCHNSRLGEANHDLTLESPHGDSLIFGLCPSQPAVREYLVSLLRDLDSRADFTRIELETFDYFHGRGFGWHHDKFHTQLGELGEFLFGLCFCESCRERGEDAGIDVEQAQQEAADTIDALAESHLPHDVAPGDWLIDHPEVLEYAQLRCQGLGELYGDLAAATDADLGAYIGMFDMETSWRQGLSLDRLEKHLDYYKVIAYGSGAAEAVRPVRKAKQLTDAELHAGVLPGHPHVHDEGTLIDIVGSLEEEGVSRCSFYNYGLLPNRNIDWIESATETV